MAPTDELVGQLKSTIESLENRVAELEGRLAGKAGAGSSSDGMRMILMGPPGAGTFPLHRITPAALWHVDIWLEEIVLTLGKRVQARARRRRG